MRKIILLFVIYSLQVIAGTDPAKICDEDAVSAKLLRDWKKNNKDRICLEAECTLSDSRKMQREKCFFQQEHPNVIMVSTSDHTLGSMKSRAVKVMLNGEEKCTDACMEGLKKKSCVECFKDRALEYKEEESLNYPEIGRPISKSTKCYYACMDKEGPIQKTRVLSPECISCVGSAEVAPESFEYIQTKSGACFELDSTRRIFSVNAKLCLEAKEKLNRTIYHSSKSVTQWLFNAGASCYEVDELTFGHIVKIEVERSHCGLTAEINDSDRSLIKEDKATSKPTSRPKASKQ